MGTKNHKTIIKPKENEGNAMVFTAFVDNKKFKKLLKIHRKTNEMLRFYCISGTKIHQNPYKN